MLDPYHFVGVPVLPSRYEHRDGGIDDCPGDIGVAVQLKFPARLEAVGLKAVTGTGRDVFNFQHGNARLETI